MRQIQRTNSNGLDVDMATAFACRDVLSVHSLEEMSSLDKTDTPPHALPPISRLVKINTIKTSDNKKSSLVNIVSCKQQTIGCIRRNRF